MTRRAMFRLLERERENFAAERRLMLETICHLVGNPMTVSDRELFVAEQQQPDPDEGRYIASPEQLPDV